MKTSQKISLFRKEWKAKYAGLGIKPSEAEIRSYIQTSTMALKHLTEEKQVKMAAAMAADYYRNKQIR